MAGIPVAPNGTLQRSEMIVPDEVAGTVKIE